MSKIEVNQISSQCGSTLTIGQSGDTVTLACGATQSGFGRTGTVDWDTTAKTASFTAVSGNGYFVNTTSGTVTMTLPASPSSGDIVAFKDYANTFDTNNLIIARNGSLIAGSTGDAIISVEGQSGTLVYVDGTKGWMIVNASTDADLPAPAYITATGGIVTCCGDYKIHTFTGPGTFTVTCAGNASGSNSVDYLVVAGGASGGGGAPIGGGGGGGGAGGYRESSGAASGSYTRSPLGACVSALPVTAQGYPITVGAGGTSVSDANDGNSGSNSVFSTIISTGGGGGGYGVPVPTPAYRAGVNGGSGGGAGSGGACTSVTAPGGSGNTPPVSPPQGNAGGATSGTCNRKSSGGGGAIVVGGSTTVPASPGAGGNGATSSINATPTTRAGGGGGSGSGSGALPGAGGSGGGGAGAADGANDAVSGTTNTGGGGGGASDTAGFSSGAGGSGIVIIRYKYQ
jgi:hypothetical protein